MRYTAAMEIQLQLGDPVEVAALERFIGFVFKIDQNTLTLCSSERFDPRNLVSIAIENINSVTEFKKISAPPAQKAPEVPVPEEKGKLLQFPAKKVTEPGPEGVA